MVLLKKNLFQKLQHCLFMNQIFYINFCLEKIILNRFNRHVRLTIVLILIILWLPTGPCHKRRNFSGILLLFLLFLLNYFFLCIKWHTYWLMWKFWSLWFSFHRYRIFYTLAFVTTAPVWHNFSKAHQIVSSFSTWLQSIRNCLIKVKILICF